MLRRPCGPSRHVYGLFSLLVATTLGCAGDTESEPPPLDTDAPRQCGDGVLDEGEACDDGPDNSDSIADACRTNCELPRCGDMVVDAGETCDDGNQQSADGCSYLCQLEEGPFEVEPNDVPFQGTLTENGVGTLGTLAELDIDCFTFDVMDNGFFSARATRPDGTCSGDITLRAYDAQDNLLETAFPGEDGCTLLDPSVSARLVYLDAGLHAVCVEGLFRVAVPGYRLTIEAGDDSCAPGTIEPGSDDDLDGDGLANPCDSDDDGDGVLDTEDNCPNIPNGPVGTIPDTSDEGYIRSWLLLGPITGQTESNANCLPSPDLLGDDDGLVMPQLGDIVEDLGMAWRPAVRTTRTTSFLDWFPSVGTPRESYAVAWVRSDEAQTVELAIGHDDGARVWLGESLLGEDETCHGVVVDGFTYSTQLEAGWNRLMVKVRDNGGGWGLVARFKDTSGSPITNLEISPGGPSHWVDDQGDLDEDGHGDACDAFPTDNGAY